MQQKQIDIQAYNLVLKGKYGTESKIKQELTEDMKQKKGTIETRSKEQMG